jgi:hypothetical protein
MAKSFNECGHTKLLSSYMTPHLEAFLVVSYVNGYNKWKSKAMVDSSSDEGRGGSPEKSAGGNKRPREEDSPAPSLPSLSSVSMNSTKKFTENARGRGKFKGWTEEGLSLYNKIIEFLEQQRAKDSYYGESFETTLRLEFEKRMNASGGATKEDSRGGAKVKAKNGMELCPDVDVLCFGSVQAV